MANTVEGKNGILFGNLSGVFYMIGCEIDFTYTYSNELVGKTDVNAGSWRKYRARISDQTVSLNGVTTTTNTTTLTIFYYLQEAIRRSEQLFKLAWTDDDGGTKEIQATFIIKQIDITSAQGDWSKFTLELQGTSGITIDPVSPPSSSSDEGIDSDYWDLTEATTTVTGLGINGGSFAGKTLFLVARETAVYVPESPLTTTTGYGFDGTTITFINPGNPGPERVFVAWHD